MTKQKMLMKDWITLIKAAIEEEGECSLPIGKYERMYPDTGTFTKGEFWFTYEEKYYFNEGNEDMRYSFACFTMQIMTKEGTYESTPHELEYIYESENKEKGLQKVWNFLERFETVQNLYNDCVTKTGFSRGKGESLKETYEYLQGGHLLPDGINLESFIESRGHVF